jgi:hypothetical protein
LFEVKPFRRSFFLSLPLVLAAIWLVFVVLASVERKQRNAELGAQVSRGSVEQATLAVRRIARLSNPPLDLLVAAAVSPSGIVAHEAQLAINDLLRRWQRQLTAGRDADRIAERLDQLAEVLDQRRDAFSTNDYAWLAKTANQIVRLANKTALDGAPGLAAHCDSLLAMVDTPIMTATRPVSLNAGDLTPPTPVTAEVGAGTSQTAAVTPVDSSAAVALPEGVFSRPTQTALHAILAASDTDRHDDHASDAMDAPQPSPSSFAWRARWLRPLLGPVGIAPLLPPIARDGLSSGEFTAPSTARVGLSQVDTAWKEPADSVHSRVLLERWLTADAATARSIEQKLAERGFGTLSPELVRQLSTDVVDDRVQLVYDVMITPGLDAKPWLLLLADDASGDVRLAAVSVMATSNDPALIEAAWQVALHDRDPRVAGLAERLRSRRAR